MRTLGIDFGERRVGVAISDPLGSIAFGVCTITVTGINNAVAQVSELCQEKEVSAIIVGLPLNMDGSRGEMVERVEIFVTKLAKATGLPIETYDERLSSAMVERTLLDADMSRNKRKRVIDKLAAQVILQGYLDRQGFQADDDYLYQDDI
jgi:putative Holliday junction resolvase